MGEHIPSGAHAIFIDKCQVGDIQIFWEKFRTVYFGEKFSFFFRGIHSFTLTRGMLSSPFWYLYGEAREAVDTKKIGIFRAEGGFSGQCASEEAGCQGRERVSLVRELPRIGCQCAGQLGSETFCPSCCWSPKREVGQPKDCWAKNRYTSWGGTAIWEMRSCRLVAAVGTLTWD